MEGLSHRGALPRFLDKGVVPEAPVGAQMLDGHADQSIQAVPQPVGIILAVFEGSETLD